MQVIPSIREVLFCGNSAFAYVTISTRSRGVLEDRELVSGTLLGFGQKRTKEESQVGDGQCLWPLKVTLLQGSAAVHQTLEVGSKPDIKNFLSPIVFFSSYRDNLFVKRRAPTVRFAHME